MQPTTLRLPTDLIEQLEQRATEHGHSSRSEYIRIVLRAHVEDNTRELMDNTGDLDERIDQLEARLDRLETNCARPARHERTTERATREKSADNDKSETHDKSEDTDERETDADIEAMLNEWRPGQSREKRARQREVGRAVIEWLRDQEVASASDFKAELEPEYPVRGQAPQTWWKKTGRAALKRAKDAGLVTFVDGRKEWRWTG